MHQRGNVTSPACLACWQVKSYLERQWGKILSGRVSVQDFIFRKEVKLGHYTNPPPQALVATRAMAADPRWVGCGNLGAGWPPCLLFSSPPLPPCPLSGWQPSPGEFSSHHPPGHPPPDTHPVIPPP